MICNFIYCVDDDLASNCVKKVVYINKYLDRYVLICFDGWLGKKTTTTNCERSWTSCLLCAYMLFMLRVRKKNRGLTIARRIDSDIAKDSKLKYV